MIDTFWTLRWVLIFSLTTIAYSMNKQSPYIPTVAPGGIPTRDTLTNPLNTATTPPPPPRPSPDLNAQQPAAGSYSGLINSLEFQLLMDRMARSITTSVTAGLTGNADLVHAVTNAVSPQVLQRAERDRKEKDFLDVVNSLSQPTTQRSPPDTDYFFREATFAQLPTEPPEANIPLANYIRDPVWQSLRGLYRSDRVKSQNLFWEYPLWFTMKAGFDLMEHQLDTLNQALRHILASIPNNTLAPVLIALVSTILYNNKWMANIAAARMSCIAAFVETAMVTNVNPQAEAAQQLKQFDLRYFQRDHGMPFHDSVMSAYHKELASARMHAAMKLQVKHETEPRGGHGNSSHNFGDRNKSFLRGKNKPRPHTLSSGQPAAAAAGQASK
jgi:hypothetical protein